MKRILILYRELAAYFVECLNHLCENHQVEAVVVAYPVNKDAPFQFVISPRIQVIQRDQIDLNGLQKLVKEGKFDLIFCGGWADKEYLQAIRQKKCPSLLGFDNQWNGSLKHIASSLYGRFKIKPLFDYAFVPGSRQRQFALHLGFTNPKIIDGAYSCDVPRFSKIHEIRLNTTSPQKKKLIYTGRYAEEKFIMPLLEIIKELKQDGDCNWELHCAGTGPLRDQVPPIEGVFHHGFMQPDQLLELMKEGSAFVLPSTFEPWGVVVHEFAAAGYPLILSDAVGAAEVFLQTGKNGFLFKSGNREELKEKLNQLFHCDDETLRSMGNFSNLLSKKITPETWANSIYSIM